MASYATSENAEAARKWQVKRGLLELLTERG